MAAFADSPTVATMKRDSAWWVSLVFALLALVEVSVRDDLPSRAGALAFTLAIAGAVGFRRSHPLAATAFAFSLATIATLVRHHFALPEVTPASAAAILILPYALCRWASRRHVIAGVAFIVLTWFTSLLSGELLKLDGGVPLPAIPEALFKERLRAPSQPSDPEGKLLPHMAWMAERLAAGWHKVTLHGVPSEFGEHSFSGSRMETLRTGEQRIEMLRLNGKRSTVAMRVRD